MAKARIFGLLRENLTGRMELDFMRKAAADLLGEMSRKTNGELGEHRARLARTEQRIAGLVQFISDGDHSDYVRSTLLDLEAQAKTEKAAIAALLERQTAAIRLPSPDETVQRAVLFEKMSIEDPTRGREELGKLFEDGKVMLKPQSDGVYLAEGKLFPLAIFSVRLGPETPKARDSFESSGLPALLSSVPGSEPGFTCSSEGCAGAQDTLTNNVGFPYEFVVPGPPDNRHRPDLWGKRRPRVAAVEPKPVCEHLREDPLKSQTKDAADPGAGPAPPSKNRVKGSKGGS